MPKASQIDPRPCNCGSYEPSYELYDARGIYVQRVCDRCVEEVKSHYRPEIFTDSDYWTCEDIEED